MRIPPRLLHLSTWLVGVMGWATLAAGQMGQGSGGGGQPRVHFAGATIADPPEQDAAWVAPATKLPRFLVTATTDLFAAGMADPRGTEYRAVKIGDSYPNATHGFVYSNPAQPAEQFVVAWNGIIYQALAVEDRVDLDADIRTLIDSVRASQAATGTKALGRSRHQSFHLFGGAAVEEAGPDQFSVLKVCLLLRLGRTDLAEGLLAAGTDWTPAQPPAGLTSYGFNLRTLASDHVDPLYNRAVDALGRADDVVALDAARRVAAFVDRIEPRLAALGFPAVPSQQRRGEAPPHFGKLTQCRSLLADLERRAREPARGPIPGPEAPAAERVAALVRDLDQIIGWGGMNGFTSPTGSATERQLVQEGDAAVEPLLQVLETDHRLTRTISYPGSRSGQNDRSIALVYPVAESALLGIFGTRVIPGARGTTPDTLADRQREAAALRAFWVKNRAVPELERFYRRLANDQATSAEWIDAAQQLAQPASYQDRAGPRRGEALRTRTNPSVTDLIARRVAAIGGSVETGGSKLMLANQLARTLATWDPVGAVPTLQAQVRQSTQVLRERSASEPKLSGLETDIAALTLLRQKIGDPGALADYAVWARRATPGGYNPLPVEMFEPLWLFPDDPALAGVAEALFADPASPWVPLYRPGVRPAIGDTFSHGLVVTPLLGVEPFRNLVLAGLADRAPFSTVETDPDGKTRVNLGESSYQTPTIRPDSPLRPAPGSTLPLRRADFFAQKLGTLDGFPAIDLWWPLAARDAAIAACESTLRQYGARLRDRWTTPDRASLPPSERERTSARLTFDRLDHPATVADVAAGRAIFHLDGAEVRLGPLPAIPLAARWTALAVSDDDPDRPVFAGMSRDPASVQQRLDQLRAGQVWQAEEVKVGDHWQRFYGFVGRNGLFQVPAAEIEFLPPEQVGWSAATTDFAARVSFDPEHANRIGGGGSARLGEPIPVEFWLWNSRGMPVAAPTDWFRGGPEPSVARGVTVQLTYRPYSGQSGEPNNPPTTIPLRATARHEAGQAMLDPTASRSLGRVDLRDLFTIDQPGFYVLSFRADDWPDATNRPTKGTGYFQILGPASTPAR